jgi:hypothetical protein
MDSPIVVSDGASTHLRHKGSGSDFQVTNDGVNAHVMVNDPGFTVTKGECVGVVKCPASFMNGPLAGWSLDVVDGSGNDILTMTSQNVSIVVDFHGNKVDLKPDGSGDTAGTDIGQHDFTFASATFTNGSGANPETITCNAKPCKLKIHYHN